MPVILKPKHQIKELTNENELKSYEQRKRVGSSVRYTFKTMKQNVLTSMALPELSGPLLGLQMVTRSFVPRGVGGFIRNLRKTMLQNLIQHSRLIMFMTQRARYLSVLRKKKK